MSESTDTSQVPDSNVKFIVTTYMYEAHAPRRFMAQMERNQMHYKAAAAYAAQVIRNTAQRRPDGSVDWFAATHLRVRSAPDGSELIIFGDWGDVSTYVGPNPDFREMHYVAQAMVNAVNEVRNS
jgi:hypothetical protein